ncbi:hypothetical protein MOMA_05841 [Moraxella macacae 0408225]|uniref:Surface-adhesin protein E-like domain-containing protein n=1 Tax=Moraxella macacae 0408225 TaxID=1230338 RepID=L2F6L0_9GAMM|nr:surface-adhesin E family protein [Moraxella macacae]ELA08058.1 hypothetical protein MOMA_05841 [Moraxella macacae 0408225]
MKKLMLASLLLISSQMTMAADWALVGTGMAGKKISIDNDSIQGYYFNGYDKDKYYVTAWVKYNYPKLQTIPSGKSKGKKYKEDRSFWYADCLNNKHNIGEIHYYSVSGAVVHSEKYYVSTSSSDSWERIIPDTVGEKITERMCAIYQLKQSYKK